MRLAWRNTLNTVMLSLTAVCTFITVAALFLILGYLLWNGGKITQSRFLHPTAEIAR